MSLGYPDTITLTRAASESTSSMGGTSTSGSTTIYDGKADVQDREVVFRTEDGALEKEGDAVAFLPDDADVTTLEIGDVAAISYETGVSKSGRVAKIHLLDYKVIIKYD